MMRLLIDKYYAKLVTKRDFSWAEVSDKMEETGDELIFVLSKPLDIFWKEPFELWRAHRFLKLKQVLQKIHERLKREIKSRRLPLLNLNTSPEFKSNDLFY